MKRLICLFLLAVVTAAPAQAQEAPAGMIERDIVERNYVERGDALELVRHLFSDDRAESLASARLWYVTHGVVGYRLDLFGPAAVNAYGLCERQQYRYDLENPHPSLRAPPGVLVAMDERVELGIAIPGDGTCPTDSGYARTSEGLPAEATRQQMAWLWEMVRAARAGDELPVAVTCRADEPGRCDNPTEALASLPFDILQGLNVTGPIRTETPANGRAYRVATPVETLDNLAVHGIFGYDDRTFTTWQVSWRVVGGEISQIHLWREQVYYH